MMNARRSETLKIWAFFAVLFGACVALLMSGGCNTMIGLGRDLTGAFDGAMYQAETNGQSSRAVRGN